MSKESAKAADRFASCKVVEEGGQLLALLPGRWRIFGRRTFSIEGELFYQEESFFHRGGAFLPGEEKRGRD